ncbi:50S ribosomal protein L25/general stress protein Ctc [Bacillus sp. 03113]|uniref:50S ribosomal protein L25/general stress protein Ctc n=1 Tax=Bacillus sp. 03113 TaxID=2578211 RepID=UPI0011417A57|nr:50S ribosomal protein L25/general stress protein Ctc [Bacillus sp. 03113]
MSTLLQAKVRRKFQHSNLTKLREGGNIPAVVYGSKLDSKPIYLNGPELLKTMKSVGRNGVISLDVEGKQQSVILSEYQSDPLSHKIIHVDFLAVDMNKDITADVKVVLVGEASGVKDGGVLQQSLHEVSVTARPNDIPSSIDVDITNLQVGETLTIASVKIDGNVHLNHEEEEVIASILPPRQEEEISTGEKQEEAAPDNLEGRETEVTE